MNTRRKAVDDGTYYGERYASSPAYQRGLLGSDVAPRAALLESPEDVETVLFLQWQSWQPGGLEAFAERLRQRWPELLVPRELRPFTKRMNQVLSPAERASLPWQTSPTFTPEDLAELLTPDENPFEYDAQGIDSAVRRRAPKPARPMAGRPQTVADLVSRCAECARAELAHALKAACLCPEKKADGGEVAPSRSLADAAPWYFPELFECVRKLMAEHATARLAAVVDTEVARKLFTVFEDAQETHQMFLALGEHKIGKSTVAKAWCEAFPGRSRYVAIPDGNDDENFFRAFSKALGLASGTSVQNRQMRDNLHRMLHLAPVLLVCDTAAYLWPRNNRREALPKRMEWLTSALVDRGVPVVLLAGTEFVEDQRTVAKKTGWDMDQFLSRVGETVFLSGQLSRGDVLRIARATLEHFDPAACDSLADCVSVSSRGMSAFEPLHKRASVLARRAGRATVCKADVLDAVEYHLAPTERLLKAGMEGGDLASAARSPVVARDPAPSADLACQASRLEFGLGRRAGNLVASS